MSCCPLHPGVCPESLAEPTPQGQPQVPVQLHSRCPVPEQREKKRVIFLYNEMLRKRQAFLQRQRRRVAQHAQRWGLVSADTGLGTEERWMLWAPWGWAWLGWGCQGP